MRSHRVPKGLRLSAIFVMTMTASIIADAKVSDTRTSPTAFAAAQLEYQQNEVLKLAIQPGEELLPNYGVDLVLVDELTTNLIDLIRGDFFARDLECGEATITALKPRSSEDAVEDRLDYLIRGGTEVLWATSEVSALTRAFRKEQIGETADEQSKAAHIAATCKRIRRLVTELSCLASNADSCPMDLKDRLANAATTVSGYKKKIMIVDQWNAPIKAAVHRYLPKLFSEIEERSELYTEITSVATAKAGSNKRLIQLVRNSIKQAIIHDAYTSLFETFEKLPSEVKKPFISSPERASLATRASVSLKKIIKARPTVIDGQLLIPEPINSSDRAQAEAEIAKFVDSLAGSFLEHSYLDDFAGGPTDQRKDPLKQVGEDVCRALSIEGQHDNWGSLVWGTKPTDDNRLGFRINFLPVGKQKYVDYLFRDMYQARIDLLLLLPGGAEYAHREIKDANGRNAECGKTIVDRYHVIDLGVVVEDIYRDESARSGFAKGFRLASFGYNNIISTEHIKHSFEQLGIPAGWVTERPDWSISEDFQNISVALPVFGRAVTLQIVKSGVFDFDINATIAQLCKELERHVLPDMVGSWFEGVSLPSGKLSYRGDASQAIAIPYCAPYNYREAYSPEPPAGSNRPNPIDNSQLAADIQLSLDGKIGTRLYSWPVSVSIDVSPDKIAMRSALFGAVPEALKSHAQKVVDTFATSLPLLSTTDWNLAVSVGAPTLTDSWQNLQIPLSIEVSSESCASESIGLALVLAEGKLVGTENLGESILSLTQCGAERRIAEIVEESVPSCDAIARPIFGLLRMETEPLSQDTRRCELSISGVIGSREIVIAPVVASLGAGGKWHMDFSDAHVSDAFLDVLKQRLSLNIRNYNPTRLALNASFSKNALLVNVTILADGPDDLVGDIEIGTLTVSADGTHNFKTELNRVLAKRIKATLEPKLNAIVRRIAPEQVEDIEITVDYRGQLLVHADLNIRFNEDILIPASLKLLPKVESQIFINKEFLRQQASEMLERYINPFIPLKAGSVKVDAPQYRISPSNDITFITGVTIDLDELGQVKLKSIYLTGRGIDFKGRAEVLVEEAILLTPSPAPIYLTSPGIFYDFRQQRVGALGALTVLLPSTKELFHIDAELFTSDPETFLKELGLSGEMVLMDSIPVVFTDGALDFPSLQVTFNARTSELFSKVLSARIDGALKAQKGLATLRSELSLLGVSLTQTDLILDIQACPNRCIKANSNIDFLIGKGTIGVKFGPLLVDAEAKLNLRLDILGKNYGKADVDASLVRARLEGSVSFMKLRVVTPRLEDMTPPYIAHVIASLLNVRLEDIKQWLENPEIELAPAGTPGRASPSTGYGRDDGTSGGAQGDASRAGADTGSAVDTKLSGRNTEEELRDLLEESQLPPDAKPPRQRDPKANGRAAAACHPENNLWGHLYYTPWSSRWHFQGDEVAPRVFETICIRAGGSGPWEAQTGAFFIHDDFAPLETESIYGINRLGDMKCESTDEAVVCRSDISNYSVSHLDLGEDKKRPSGQVVAYPHYYTFSRSVKRQVVEETIDLSERDVDRLSQHFYLLAEEGPLGDSESRKYRYLQKYVARILREQLNVDAERIKSLKKSPGFFDWLSGSSAFKVTFTVAQTEHPERGWDTVRIWVNQQTDRALLDYVCKPDRDFEPCLDVDSDSADHRALEMIKTLGFVKNSLPVLQDPVATAWVLNDAIPAILYGNNPPSLGRLISPDSAFAQCRVKSIQVFDTAERLTFRFIRVDEHHTQHLTGLSLDKEGPHSVWASSGDDSLFRTMASYLACQDDPAGWLAQYHPWLTPTENTVDKALLFFDLFHADRTMQEVLRIETDSGLSTFSVPRTNPYAAKKGSTVELGLDIKRKMYSLILEHSADRAVIIVNDFDKFEAFVLFNSDLELQEPRVSVLLRKTSDRSLPFDSPAQVTAKNIAVSRLNICFAGNTRFGGDLISYLRLDRPSIDAGVDPVLLLRAVDSHDRVDCSVH